MNEIEENGDVKIAVNSIQRTLHVARMYVNPARTNDIYLPYDVDNLYPNKIKSIADRSGTTKSAIETYSAFMSGDGFPGMDTVVNREGQTLWDILRHVCDSRAMFRGWALHFNYNMLGQIVEINPINFENVRIHRNLKKFVVNPDWPRRMIRKKDEVIYAPFWPENVVNEIKECGDINKYVGQLMYWIPNAADYYTTCEWDAVIDDAQFEAEAKLYGLSSIQNDYSLGGYLVYPKALVDEKEIEGIKKDLKSDKGSANAGGSRVFGVMPSEQLAQWKYFWPISRNNIDSLHKNQIETAKLNIYAKFKQPPILNGVAQGGMFNQESFADAFNYYNVQVETERKEIEKGLSKILKYSIWANIAGFQIVPKQFTMRSADGTQPAQVAGQPGTEPAAAVNETLTNLTGRQLQGVFRITKRYKKGELTFEQAAALLSSGFGFDDEQIKIWLVNDDEEVISKTFN
jgi:hypothetical protein